MLSQSAYIFAAKVAGYGIRILLPVFLVRILTKADFGAYNQFFLIELIFSTIFQMGVNQSQFFFIPRDEENSGGYFVNSLLLNLALFTAAYGLVFPARGFLAAQLGMPILVDLFLPLAAYSLLMMLNIAVETYLTARRRFAAAAAYDVGRQLLASAATLAAAWLTRDLRIVIYALVASRLVSLVAGIAYVHLGMRGFRSRRYFFALGAQIRYGVVLGAAGILWTLVSRMHELLVSRSYDIETYAVYAAGCKQIPVLQFFTQSVVAVALVRFAQLEKERDWRGVRELWDRILGSFYGVGIPVTLLFVVLARPIVLAMFTDSYAGAVVIYRLGALAMLFHLLNPTLVLRAMDRNDVSVKVHAVMLALMPAALYAGMKAAGPPGIVGAHAVMLIAGRAANHAVLNRLVPVRLPYVAAPRAVFGFYADVWGKGMRKLRRAS